MKIDKFTLFSPQEYLEKFYIREHDFKKIFCVTLLSMKGRLISADSFTVFGGYVTDLDKMEMEFRVRFFNPCETNRDFLLPSLNLLDGQEYWVNFFNEEYTYLVPIGYFENLNDVVNTNTSPRKIATGFVQRLKYYVPERCYVYQKENGKEILLK